LKYQSIKDDIMTVLMRYHASFTWIGLNIADLLRTCNFTEIDTQIVNTLIMNFDLNYAELSF
jgi:hypothetical protein